MESSCFPTRNGLTIVIWTCKYIYTYIYSINTSEFMSTVKLENFILKENVFKLLFRVPCFKRCKKNTKYIQKKEEIIS